MQPSLLDQLRDIHLPNAPALWPPAPGWWLTAALLTAALVALGRYLRARRRRTLPVRTAQRLLDELYRDYQQGAVAATSFVHGSNELLKRLLIHTLRDPTARPASGRSWLDLLDRYAASNEFTQGAGRVLGDTRFQPAPSIDVAALFALLQEFLQQLVAKSRELK